MLLKQTLDDKLPPNYELDPYVVTHKDGNAVVVRDANGNNKMRNVAHMKKFVELVTIEMEESEHKNTLCRQQSQNSAASQHLQPSSRQHRHRPETPPDNFNRSRPMRARQAPAWMKDYVCH